MSRLVPGGLQRRQEAARMRRVSARLRDLRHVELHQLHRGLELEQEGAVRARESQQLQLGPVLRERPVQALSLVLRDLRRSYGRSLHILSESVASSRQALRVPVRRRVLLRGTTLAAGLRPLSAHLQELRLPSELHGVSRWVAATERRMQIVLRARVKRKSLLL